MININCLPGLTKIKIKLSSKNSKNNITDLLNSDSFIEHPNKVYHPIDIRNDMFSEIYLHDHTFSYFYVKSDKLKFLGKTEKEVIGLHPSKVLPPDMFNILNRIYKMAKVNHKHSQSKYFWRGKIQVIDSFPIVDMNKSFRGLLIFQKELDKHELET